MSVPSYSLRALALTAALSLAGCGGSAAPLPGKLVSKGGPPPAGKKYTVVLSNAAASYSGEVAADGAFTLQNQQGGPQAGKYNLSVVIYPDMTGGGPVAPPVEVRLPGEVDVSGPLTVELDQLR